MRIAAVVTLSLCCGLLAAGVSAWSAQRLHKPIAAEEIRGFRPSSDWDKAVKLARERGVPVLVYVTLAHLHSPDQLQGLIEDASLQRAMAAFVPIRVTLNGNTADRALASRLGIHAAPLFLIVDPSGPEPEIVDALEPVCDTAFERRGLTSELVRTSGGTSQLRELAARYLAGNLQDGPTDEPLALAYALRLEASGRWDEARRVRARSLEESPAAQGTLTRYGRMRDALLEPGPSTPADQETALEIHLLREDDATLLFMGWTSAAGRLERLAAAADSEHLGVPSIRWERRLRETTRKAWISCPDDLVLPFGAIVVERFARAPADLDSLDRAFMGAVIRTMAKALKKASEAERACGQAWLDEARAALPQR